ncbi:Telomerase holoenzyme Est3 subunit [Botryosphaeria dothidea]|uniref:Telomerase holoenzyme Est3 subunit n=1 Tax=Botryosphaeria dothidea TaxID=55169 RepID=A0A8H4N5I0_9PEZI|nr:Telomerase holoenzyme Est3 subunit [Botryosphaeria dothidea]
MASDLKAWIGTQAETEVGDALDYWAEDANGRTSIESSQQLETMFEDDGTNFRIRVYMNESDNPRAQIIEVEEDEPIQAIISDKKNSVKVRFSKKLVAALEQRRKQPITKKMQGGVLFIKTFEIVIPRFSTIDEDPIYFLLTDADLQGFGGSLIYGHPIPVQHRQKVKRLLNKFHNVKSEDLSEDEEMEDSVMQSDDDMLSQGIPEEDKSTQYGTQMPMSQLPGLTKGNKNKTIGIKMEHSRVMKPEIHPVQALVAALKSKPQRVTAADRSLMPPPAPQKPTVQPTQSAQSRSISRSVSPDEQVQDAEQTEKQSEEISHADNFADDRDEDGPTLIGEDDVIQPERGQDIQDKDLHQDLSTEDKVLENATYTPIIPLFHRTDDILKYSQRGPND